MTSVTLDRVHPGIKIGEVIVTIAVTLGEQDEDVGFGSERVPILVTATGYDLETEVRIAAAKCLESCVRDMSGSNSATPAPGPA